MLIGLGNRHTKKSAVYLKEQRNVSGEPEADNLRAGQKKFFSGHESKFIF